MSEPELQSINPYAPAASIQEELVAPEDDYTPVSFAWTAGRWFLVCSISALPSFFVGAMLTRGQWPPMVIGILIFSVAYTFADYLTARMAWRRIKLIRRTLKTMYATRVAISIIFPIGYFLDLFCGFVSVPMSQAITGTDFTADELTRDLVSVLVTTLVQGCVMNAVLAVYGLIILAATLIWMYFRGQSPPALTEKATQTITVDPNSQNT